MFYHGWYWPNPWWYYNSICCQGFNLPIVLGSKKQKMYYWSFIVKINWLRVLKMAHVPSGVVLCPKNPVSGARLSDWKCFVLAGVPRIMQSMLIIFFLNCNLVCPFFSNTVTCNLMESTIAEKLAKIQDCYDDVEIGSYPFPLWRAWTVCCFAITREWRFAVCK